MSKVDLHIHSNYSDGSDSVSELIEKIQQNGLTCFSLTDHDTFCGCEKIEKLVPENIRFIRGIELTCQIQDIKCHILGYNYDITNQQLAKLIEKGKKLRQSKLETRIEYLKKVWDITFTKEETDWLYSRQSVVKTHLANLLVKRGLANNNVEAMQKYLDACKTGNTRFDGEEAISVLNNAGGIVVWAHPLGGEGEEHLDEKNFIQQFEIMKKFGIDGLECYYSRYDEKETDFLYNIANDNKLIITGGSDYHGTNKENIKIGQLNNKNLNIAPEKITLISCI